MGGDQDPADPGKYWPPSDPDQIEAISASYVQPGAGEASIRLFNLSPDTTHAGMRSSAPGASVISGVAFSLGTRCATSTISLSYVMLYLSLYGFCLHLICIIHSTN